VLLERTDALGAERAAQRLADALSAKFSVLGREASVHASIGIALTGPHAMSAEELLRNADIAMYKAKSDGNRRWALYEPVLHRRLRHRHELASELEGSVERGEIVVNYQPAVSLADGTIHAFEALARWQHPERGLLLPGDFLGVAEEVGLINEIGSCVIEQAFRCASEWQDAVPEGSNVGLWINLAPAEIIDEHLIENFELALARTHLDVHRLTVEITESSVIRDEHNALRAMRRLRDLGAQLSIDDFGTCYSSLSRLAEFPIEMLKIPKPFIDLLTSDQAQASFVDAILRLAGSLGLRAVGEGIEHLAQAQRLQELGCELGQGYYFSPPIAADEALRLVRAGAAEGHASPLAAAGPNARLRVVA
jgi:predicted signal transduction protein with EAL and GGDEF domain